MKKLDCMSKKKTQQNCALYIKATGPPPPPPTFTLALDASNATQKNFDSVVKCARLSNPSIELVITLGLDIPVWKEAANNMDQFGPVLSKFMTENSLDGINFDWEDNVDTTVYMQLLTGIRKVLDKVSPKKRLLITVAPGWPRYPWDASANGVVDAFDMMSYSNSLEDLTARVKLFTETYKVSSFHAHTN
jgi:hypothetical protein